MLHLFFATILLTFSSLTIPISLVTCERLLPRTGAAEAAKVPLVYHAYDYPVYVTPTPARYPSPPPPYATPPYVTPITPGDEVITLPGRSCLEPGASGTATFINLEGKLCTWTGIVGTNFGVNTVTSKK